MTIKAIWTRVKSSFKSGPKFVDPVTCNHQRTKTVHKLHNLYRCRKCGAVLFDPLRQRGKVAYFYYPLRVLGQTVHICFPLNTIVDPGVKQ